MAVGRPVSEEPAVPSQNTTRELCPSSFGVLQHSKRRLFIASPPPPPSRAPAHFNSTMPSTFLIRYWDYYNKVLEGPRPLLAPKGILLADNVLFHELVPLAEAAAAEDLQGSVATVETAARKVGGLAPTPRRLKIAQSLDGFNKRVRDDDRVEVLMLPLRDGLSVVRWRDGRYPNTTGDPSTPR